MTGRALATLVSVLAIAGCSAQPLSPTPGTTSPGSPSGSAIASSLPAEAADVIFSGGPIITMDEGQPTAEALAIRGDRILAVGSTADLQRFQGPNTLAVDLGGRTLVPGFIDAHQHRIGDGPRVLATDPKALIDAAIAQGYTTIDELYVDETRLAELRDLDQAGVLRLRVNAYLPVNENSAEGRLLGPYFEAYRPGQMISPHVRVAGLKIFTDFANATFLLWQQADLDAIVLEQHRKGWPLAIKTVSTRSLAMILEAIRATEAVEAHVVNSRIRLEHLLFATADQIAAIRDLGLVPVINLNIPGQLVGMSDIDALVASEPAGSYAPWRSLFEAGIPSAGMSGFPSVYADEPEGAPFGSALHLIFQGVTRVGNLGATSPPALLDQAISAEQAIRALTINAARAAFEDSDKGSLTAGKLADMAVLSADPLSVSTDEINQITVLMTMVGGEVEYCAAGSETVCPQ